jgi:hypothetical protein
MRRTALLVAPALAALVLSGCSGEDGTVVVESGESERISALSRQVQELEAALHAAKITEREAAELRGRLAELERKVRSFEEGFGSPDPAPAPSSSEPEDGETGRPAGSVTLPLPSGETAVFDEAQVASFRALQEEVERRKEVEQRTARIERQLTSLAEREGGIVLPPDVRQRVIDRTLAHQTEVQKLFRGGFGRTDEERAQNTARLESLRESFETDLRRMVSDEHADKVVETLGRAFPGFVRRIDRTTRRDR